jgi:alpha-glucosidase (family GH31 glycosyl hydrolase)
LDHNSPFDLFQRIRFTGEPVANPASLVVSGRARFTILTSRLIRLEWSETGQFENRGTYAFPTRYGPAPDVATQVQSGVLTIDTGTLRLRYVEDSGRFSADNLSISFDLNGKAQTWLPETLNPTNLRGTRRTLDVCEGDAALEEGLLSRSGWALFDDSRSVVFNHEDGWVAPRPDYQVQDWYFFGYGHDYKAALSEYVRFGGRVPLIPRYVLGAWWSRYWAYSDQELKDLVRGFEEHDLPLDVLVVDMDWHTPHSWTGYTWNRQLFPDPPAFLQWVHDKGLRATLNLHPAQGVQHFEEVYPRFAEAMGVDPASGEPIPFRITDKRFVRHYFELLHHPMEDDGVDFWWMDWQQGQSCEVRGLDPLPWINHLHFRDSTRRGQRGMLYSRWGGLGNHRYPIGFSGDTYVTWEALQFQPYFTAAASNVAYGWWSHDIGGHMGGATEPELYARWVQYGALSPCLRLHGTKDPLTERRPWKYPGAAYQAAKAAFHWRYQLVPYLYTMARVASDTGVSLCRPMYYEYPEQEAAYAARYQYFFGDQMIAAPIVHPAAPETGMAAADVWIPEGTWIDYTTKETFIGPRWVRLVGDLNRIPMLMKAGAILPLGPPASARVTDVIPKERLIVSVFPGADGSFRLYEDDGATQAYQEGQYEWTGITMHMEDEDTWAVGIAPVEGRCDALPERRGYEIRLEGSRRPQRVTIDGEETVDWRYYPDTLTTVIQVPVRDKRKPLAVVASAEGGISALGEARNHELILSDIRRLLGPGTRDVRTDAPGRADAVARLGGPFARIVEFTTPEEASQALGRVIVGGPMDVDQPYDLELILTLYKEGQTEEHVIQAQGVTESQIIDLPVAFNGTVRPMRWEAAVAITWHGETLTIRHRSQPLFASIYAWRTLVYDQDEELIPLESVMDAKGKINGALAWKTRAQASEGLTSLTQPHALFFYREYEPEVRAGVRLAGYLTTTVVSPDDRGVTLVLRSRGPLEVYLNGQRVEVMPAEMDREGLHPLLRDDRREASVRLRAGRNTLLVHSQTSQTNPHWLVCGALLTPGGGLMTDLVFE